MNTIDMLKAVADETRLRILSLLLESGELCSCELESLLALSQSNTSRHIGRLRWVQIIESWRESQWIHYRINKTTWDSFPVIQQSVESARQEIEQFRIDLERLEHYRASDASCTTIKQWIRSQQ